MTRVETDRLIIRHPMEHDRSRFVELFTDEAFTVFSDGVHDVESANNRFDRMLGMVGVVAYAKQPVIERTSGAIVGYTGADSVVFDGIDRLEWGWRLVPGARARGYATETAAALLSVADNVDDGEMLCLIDADNHASRRVAEKVGSVGGGVSIVMDDPTDPTDLLVRPIGAGGPPLLAPESPSIAHPIAGSRTSRTFEPVPDDEAGHPQVRPAAAGSTCIDASGRVCRRSRDGRHAAGHRALIDCASAAATTSEAPDGGSGGGEGRRARRHSRQLRRAR